MTGNIIPDADNTILDVDKHRFLSDSLPVPEPGADGKVDMIWVCISGVRGSDGIGLGVHGSFRGAVRQPRCDEYTPRAANRNSDILAEMFDCELDSAGRDANITAWRKSPHRQHLQRWKP